MYMPLRFSGRRCLSTARDIVGRYTYYFGIWEPNLTSWIKNRPALLEIRASDALQQGSEILIQRLPKDVHQPWNYDFTKDARVGPHADLPS